MGVSERTETPTATHNISERDEASKIFYFIFKKKDFFLISEY